MQHMRNQIIAEKQRLIKILMNFCAFAGKGMCINVKEESSKRGTEKLPSG
jgi:hypothetical protein